VVTHRTMNRSRTLVTLLWLLVVFIFASALIETAADAAFGKMIDIQVSCAPRSGSLFLPIAGTVALLSFWRARPGQISGLILGELIILGGAKLDVSPPFLYVLAQVVGMGLVAACCWSLSLFLLRQYADEDARIGSSRASVGREQ
jgi:hypothetical protein